MATFPGSLALSDTRLARLKKRTGVKGICAIWTHFVSYLEAPSDELDFSLRQILDYGDFPDPSKKKSQVEKPYSEDLVRKLNEAVVDKKFPQDARTVIYFVIPRTGTISPWSSLATAIATTCGLGSSIKRIERGIAMAISFDSPQDGLFPEWKDLLYDRMTQELSIEYPDVPNIFQESPPAPLKIINILKDGVASRDALVKANREMGLALDPTEIDFLVHYYGEELRRDPTDVELFMFGAVNSEHCRHKQFNASFTVDGMRMAQSLFDMIKSTHKAYPKYTYSAYSDNAAVFEGIKGSGSLWAPNHSTGEWSQTKELVHFIGKVESHNHPTSISPYPGAATGSGGEIRDEGAVGRGSKPKAGLCGFCVSDLLIPGHEQPWERDVGRPGHVASAFDIMTEGPLGAAAFNNEFGRPCIAGFFRTFLQEVSVDSKTTELRGYHKPIMLAGGVGTVRPQLALKPKDLVKAGDYLLVLGGPAMLIGLGGGAASSIQSGQSSIELDFASVQRGNPEVQRRVQEVIDACCALGPTRSPIALIHDIGAGGLSNGLPELVHDAGLGATLNLRDIESADRGMSPLEIFCNEAQERYVCAVSEASLQDFLRIAKRERCGVSNVGRATKNQHLALLDRDSEEHPKPIDIPMAMLFAKPPKMSRIVETRELRLHSVDRTLRSYLDSKMSDPEILKEAVKRVLSLPAVGSKSFLITIGDRTVGGLTARDQMVGRWQTPVADVAVTATSLMLGVQTGEAFAIGEKPTLALSSPAASVRMALGECLMNLAAADLLDSLPRIKFSANWMSPSTHPGEGANLYEAVQAVTDLCHEIGTSIPVGKDSMSMKMRWTDEQNKEKEVTAPLSLVMTAFAPVRGLTQKTWTPALRRVEDVGETLLMYVDLALGKKTLGGSALAQVFGQIGKEVPDIRDVELFKDFFDAIEQLHESGIVLAYHDVSDGGLFTTLSEMMFAGRCGLDVMLDQLCLTARNEDLLETLFHEELGAVFQVRKSDETNFKRCFATCGPPTGLIRRIAAVPATKKQVLSIYHGVKLVYSESRSTLQQLWAATSHQMQRLRDDPECADAEFENIKDDADPGLSYHLTFNPKENILPLTSSISNALFTAKPRVAILREEGTNGHAEMAFAFHMAGFSAIDVHMTDLDTTRVSLSSFVGLAACGGFSYGDVAGAGRGWALSVLLKPHLRAEFKAFFERKDTFTLGVCNGCQFLSRLKEIIPGAEDWPTFERNRSEQYEARVCMVQVADPPASSGLPPSVFLHGMPGSSLPIVTAHAEGRATFHPSPPSTSTTSTSSAVPATQPKDDTAAAESLLANGLVPLRYLDNALNPTDRYPFNPNGSPAGIAGVRTPDGRVLALMPHPERTVLAAVGSWVPAGAEGSGKAAVKGGNGGNVGGSEMWGDVGPWGRMFRSARRWVG